MHHSLNNPPIYNTLRVVPERTYEIDKLLADAIQDIEDRNRPQGYRKQSPDQQIRSMFKYLHEH